MFFFQWTYENKALLPTYFPIPRNTLKSLSNFLSFIIAQLITQTICINKDASICCMANGLRGRCFYPCIHVTGLDTLFEQMYTIWKCRVPQWNVSNCFLSKYINAICTCIYVNDTKAAGVPAKWELMLRNTFTRLMEVWDLPAPNNHTNMDTKCAEPTLTYESKKVKINILREQNYYFSMWCSFQMDILKRQNLLNK